jgi:hypothetical protein
MIINDFKNIIKNGSRTNKFKVNITAPALSSLVSHVSSLLGGNTFDVNTETISLMAKETTIPAKAMAVVDIWYRGRKYPIRGKATFENKWDVTFYNDADMRIRGFFEEWMYQIDRYDSALYTTLYTQNYLGTNSINLGYMSDITLQQLCSDGSTVTAEYLLKRAFPIAISSQKLDGADVNQISTFTVTFSYDYWTRQNTSSSNGLSDFFSHFI